MRQRKFIHLSFALAAAAASSGCTGESENFVLYRASPLDALMRIHVASFDTADGTKYNQENCSVAAGLFQSQPGTTVKYWCEKGKYKK